MEIRRRRRFMPPLGPPKASASQSVLAMWRGVDLAPEEIAVGRTAKPVGGVMDKVLSGLRIDRRQGEAEIARVCKDCLSLFGAPGVELGKCRKRDVDLATHFESFESPQGFFSDRSSNLFGNAFNSF